MFKIKNSLSRDIKSFRNIDIFVRLFLQFGVFFIPALVNSRLDPDIHHDGIMYTAALGASTGLVPNRDFLTQYGFGAPFTQGLWMHFTNSSLLSLRIFTAIQLAIVALLLFYACKKFLSPQISFLIAFGWIIQLSARIPWASIFITMISLCVFLLLFSKVNPDTYLTCVYPRLFLAGFLISLGVTFRFQIFLLFFMILFAVYLFEQNCSGLVPFAVGFMSFSLFFVFLSVLGGFLDAMITQTLIWPSKFYSPPSLTKSFITDLLWFPFVCITVTLLVVLLTNFFRDLSLYRTRLIQIALTLTITISSIAVLAQTRDGYLSLRNPKILLIDGTSKFVGFLGFWSAGTCVMIFFCLLYKRFLVKSAFPILERRWAWIAFCGIAALPQLYPLHDQVHLWYVTPTLLIGCAPVLGHYLKLRPGSRGWIVVLLGFSVVVSAITDLRDFQKARLPYSNIAMTGLLGSPTSVIELDSKMGFLEKNADDNSVGFDCIHGMYAGAGEHFLSNDPMFVNWGLERKIPIIQSSSIYVCNKTRNEINFYKSLGFVENRLWKNQDNSFDAFLSRE